MPLTKKRKGKVVANKRKKTKGQTITQTVIVNTAKPKRRSRMPVKKKDPFQAPSVTDTLLLQLMDKFKTTELNRNRSILTAPVQEVVEDKKDVTFVSPELNQDRSVLSVKVPLSTAEKKKEAMMKMLRLEKNMRVKKEVDDPDLNLAAQLRIASMSRSTSKS
tara:strand:+ start:493 stop:978 length:486 start_codon:yes stop_codon:yes gene_type:complete